MTFRTVAVLAASLAISPALATAQSLFRAWNDYCYMGAFQACASVQVGMVNFAAGNSVNTAITIKIANLEGMLGTTPWGIVGFTLRGLPANGFANSSEFPVPTFDGSAQGVALQPPYPVNFNPGIPFGPPGNFGSVWFWQASPSAPAGYTELNRETQPGDGAFAITGCDAVSNGNQPNGYLQTCGDGWVVYNFVHEGPMFTDNLQVSLDGGPGSQVSCTFDVDCVRVVPEPTTLTLLATGVAGLGALRMKRRRRHDCAISEPTT